MSIRTNLIILSQYTQQKYNYWENMSKYDNIYMEVIRMILEKYQDTYTKFITKYEEIHVNP